MEVFEFSGFAVILFLITSHYYTGYRRFEKKLDEQKFLFPAAWSYFL